MSSFRRRSSAGLALACLLGGAPLLACAAPTTPNSPTFDRRAIGIPHTDDPLRASPTAAWAPQALPTGGVVEEDLNMNLRTDHHNQKRQGSWAFRERAELRKREFEAKAKRDFVPGLLKARQTTTCMPAGSTDVEINAAFAAGGSNFKVFLCPSTTYRLSDAVYLVASGQELSTQGYPTDNTRATLLVTGSDQTVAIYAGYDVNSNIMIRNIQVNGNRPAMGWVQGGAGLLEIGGNASPQTVQFCNLYEPRGWSALHIAEGYQNSCTNSNILNNQIGPSGNSPNSAWQFNRVMSDIRNFANVPAGGFTKRQDAQAPGQWADGISISCANSKVQGNTIVDATDGMIVIFGSPGSVISGNTIISQKRVALGGINLVDYNPWGGTYNNVRVTGNTLRTEGSMIKVGVAMGIMVWGSWNSTEYQTYSGTVSGNNFQSTGGYFGYGIATAGHKNAVTSGNNFGSAKFDGAYSYGCFPQWYPPTPQAAIYDPDTTAGGSFQANTNAATIVIPVCMMPCEYSDDGCGKWPPVVYGAQSSSAGSSSLPASSSSTIASSSTATSSTLSSTSSTKASSSTQRTTSSAKTTAKTTSTKKTTSTSTKRGPTPIKVQTPTKKVNPKQNVAKPAAAKTNPKAIAGGSSGWVIARDLNDSAKFIDDRPAYSYDSDKALEKVDAQIHVEEDFHLTGRSNIPDSDNFLVGRGRSVYDKRDLVEANFMVV